MPKLAPRVLIVEDNTLVAIDEQIMVEDAGCAVVGPVGTVAEALEIIRQYEAAEDTRLEGAILDINLDGDRVWPVTDLLDEQGIPFVLATGYNRCEVPERFLHRPVLTKPVGSATMEKALKGIGVIP